MSVRLSITLSQDIQASNFVCSPIVGTTDADVTSGKSMWSGPPSSNRRNIRKTSNIKFIAITEATSISCPDLTVRYSEGLGMLGFLFCKCKKSSLKFVNFFLF